MKILVLLISISLISVSSFAQSEYHESSEEIRGELLDLHWENITEQLYNHNIEPNTESISCTGTSSEQGYFGSCSFHAQAISDAVDFYVIVVFNNPDKDNDTSYTLKWFITHMD